MLSVGSTNRWDESTTDKQLKNRLVDNIFSVVEKRFKHYQWLLNAEVHAMMKKQLPNIHDEIKATIDSYIEQGTEFVHQLRERYYVEQSVQKHFFGEVLILQRRGLRLLMPTLDPDLNQFLTALPMSIKYDHHMYYKLLKKYYPKMAAIKVPNLGTSIMLPQFAIQISRVWQHLWKKHQKLSLFWVNFDSWIRMNGRLEAFEKKYYDLDLFDRSEVINHFKEVRSGMRSLYDGDEMLNFLNVGMLIQGKT